MGLLDRYLLKLKRPAENTKGTIENLRETERHINRLPVPAPQIIEFDGATSGFALSQLETFPFKTRYPNTVIAVELFIDAKSGAPGFGTVFYYAYVDGAPLDFLNFASMNEACVRVGISTGYVTTIVTPGNHTLELWAQTTINGGTADYSHGRFLLWVL